MPGTTVLALEGTLAGAPGEDVDLTRDPLELSGASLYAMLRASSRLVLASSLDRRLVTHWLRQNGLTHHDGVVPLNERTVTSLRAGGESVTLYVDADPDRVALALRLGVPTLLFARPLFARAGFRPDLPQRVGKPWSQVVEESRAQRSARGQVRAPVMDD